MDPQSCRVFAFLRNCLERWWLNNITDSNDESLEKQKPSSWRWACWPQTTALSLCRNEVGLVRALQFQSRGDLTTTQVSRKSLVTRANTFPSKVLLGKWGPLSPSDSGSRSHVSSTSRNPLCLQPDFQQQKQVSKADGTHHTQFYCIAMNNTENEEKGNKEV